MFQSCKKVDVSVEQAKTIETIAKNFFSYKQTYSSAVISIINKLKTENERTGFVNKLPANCGLPVWDKLIVTSKTSQSSSFGEDSSDIIIIPLTITNNTLSSILVVMENDDNTYSINCYTTNGYLYYTTHGTNVDKPMAETFLTIFFYMENRTYGVTKFYHIPQNLFSNFTALDSNGNKTINIKNVDTTTQTSLAPYICVEYEVICPVCHLSSCPYTYTYTVCTTMGGGGGGNWPNGGGNPPGGDPPGGGGPGGGGSGGGCPLNGSWYNLVPPAGGCGEPPVPPAPPTEICNPYIKNLETNTNFVNAMKYLNSSAVVGAENEVGYEIRDISQYNNTTYIPGQGTPAEPIINWQFPANTFTEGLIHSHYSGLNSIFSPDDIILMARLFLKNHAKDSNNLFFAMTSQYGVPNLIKVGNPTIFRTLCEKIVGINGIDQAKMKDFRDKFENKVNSMNPDVNEREFLKIIKEMGAESGLELYQGHVDCNKWVKKRVDSFGNVSSVTCSTTVE